MPEPTAVADAVFPEGADTSEQRRVPTFAEEMALQTKGIRLVAGIDEAGRGPLAGPVVAAAVMLPLDAEPPWLGRVRDSKELARPVREELFVLIHEAALAVAVGVVDVETIDRDGIAPATRLAMKRAIEQLDPAPESLLIDYFTLPEVPLPQKGITYGDSVCMSIACASIVAKLTRDRLMVGYDGQFPGYGFRRNKGYGTPEHLACLDRLGPCPMHRRSFRPVSGMAQP
jgi:ribonuclease HII